MFSCFFFERKHKKRGSLFEKVARPVKSLPATRSAGVRGSMIVGHGNSTASRGSTINPQLMNTASRGSTTDLTGGAEAPGDSDDEDPSNLGNPDPQKNKNKKLTCFFIA